MKIIIFFLFLIVAVGSCKTNDNGCIDESKITESLCPANYDPVCGCNDETYGNACEAKRNGVTSWTEGACD